MAYNFAGGGDGDQVFLMPPDPRDWLPEGHLARAMRGAAAEVDLAPFLAACRADGQGKTAYHPRMMVALVMYCYAKGIRSSRAVEMATFDDVGARVICAGLHPDHATNARFVTRHEEPLPGLLVQSLVACARGGLVRVDVTAGDGTKVKANASMAANATAEQPGLDIAGLEKLLEAGVAAWTEQACAADAAEDALFSGDGGPPAGPPAGGTPAGAARKRTAGKLARRQAAQAKLATEARARQEQAEAERAERIAKLAAENGRLQARAAQELARGQAKVARYAQRAAARAAGSAAKLDEAVAAPAVVPQPDRPPKANTTDLASRVMPLKKGGYDQLYNLQALAGRRQVIVAIGTHPASTDTAALHPLPAAAAANLAAAGISGPIGTALFGAGYASGDNFTAPCAADLYVAVTRESRQAGQLRDAAAPLPGQPGWQAMAAKLDTPAAAPSTSSARPSSSPSSPSCSPASAAPCTTAATWLIPGSACGPPSATPSRPSAPAHAARSANASPPPRSPPWQPHNQTPGRGRAGPRPRSLHGSCIWRNRRPRYHGAQPVL
jgi:transposase